MYDKSDFAIIAILYINLLVISYLYMLRAEIVFLYLIWTDYGKPLFPKIFNEFAVPTYALNV